MKTLSLLILSDQTIPNLQFIKEFDKQVDGYVILTTDYVQKKGIKDWLLSAAKVDENRVFEEISVQAHDYNDIETKLSQTIDESYEYLVNITGGTKIMSLACANFFKDLRSTIYYISYNNELIQIFPGKTKTVRPLSSPPITLEEYLTAYGFKIIRKAQPHIEDKLLEKLFHYHARRKAQEDAEFLEILQQHRSKKQLFIDAVQGFRDFLSRCCGGIFARKESLSKEEIKQLSGEWLEEWTYKKVKNQLQLDEAFMGMGVEVEKNGVKNEFDVLFVYKDVIYSVECKTSLYFLKGEGEQRRKKYFVGEVIYKSDSLQSEFGLKPRTFVLTMGDAGGIPEDHRKRAENNKITIIDRNDLLDGKLFKKLKIPVA